MLSWCERWGGERGVGLRRRGWCKSGLVGEGGGSVRVGCADGEGEGRQGGVDEV